MIPVVDVFAGPGGLNEGFASLRRHGRPVFSLASSFEMDPWAVQTLGLRAAVREFDELPRIYRRLLGGRATVAELMLDPEFSQVHSERSTHIHQIELGAATRGESDDLIQASINSAPDWVLIGGPPCQAYSLVGRARRKNDTTFYDDHKHFLYREYLHIIDQFRPSIFVMENVKGLLSATNAGRDSMFDLILEDLQLGGAYEIRSLVVADQPKPRDFVVRAERYGIPQRRHRVILLGLRTDRGFGPHDPLTSRETATLRQAIGGLDPVEPRVSSHPNSLLTTLVSARDAAQQMAALAYRGRDKIVEVHPPINHELNAWLNPYDVRPSLHEARSHMGDDIARYAFYARAMQYGVKPTVLDLPEDLLPKHKNIQNGRTPFLDRFKVQEWDRPSSTVASHIAKDGHYYIHPDWNQSRSLTVREAARLQTFPDDYWFCGPRTMQYKQVGNAVPPLLANQIAERVAGLLGH